MSNIFVAFKEGGIFMYFILTFGVLTFGLIVERVRALYLNTKTPSESFRKQILAHIATGDLTGAERFANAENNTALGRIAAIGCHLRANAGGEEEVQARMDERLTQEISTMDKRTGFLAMFGNVSTLLGLLGTISGMIHSFAAVASASPADRATMLSLGISEAMNCTAFGLIVAIPALVAYAVFQNKTDRMVSELTESTTQIYNDLLFLSEPNMVTHTAKEMNRNHAAQAMHSNSPTLGV
jgi:biopolymer transport protein ExbB